MTRPFTRPLSVFFGLILLTLPGLALAQSGPLFDNKSVDLALPGVDEYKSLPNGLLLIPDSATQDVGTLGLGAEEERKSCVVNDCLLFVSRGQYGRAVAGLIDAVGRGDVVAHETLALMYKNGNGVDKNPQKAFDLMSVAAENGRINAQYNLGSMYFLGEGVDKNRAQGLVWLEIAAARATDADLRARIRKDRNAVAADVTRQERDTAQERAFKWLQAHGEGHLIQSNR